MGEGLGLTMEKTTTVEVLVAPRLSASFYGEIDSRCNQSNKL